MLTLASLLACGGGASGYPYADEPDPHAKEYVIGAADELHIQVWRNPDLGTRIAVRPDGSITLPLLGDMKAVGLTPSRLREAIRARLADFLKDEEPVVTVAVTAVNSYYVTVAGNVSTPGRYASPSYLTVSDAIALAGGPTRFANPDSTVILRRSEDGGVRRIPVNYERIIEGEQLEQDLVLMRGDVVFIP